MVCAVKNSDNCWTGLQLSKFIICLQVLWQRQERQAPPKEELSPTPARVCGERQSINTPAAFGRPGVKHTINLMHSRGPQGSQSRKRKCRPVLGDEDEAEPVSSEGSVHTSTSAPETWGRCWENCWHSRQKARPQRPPGTDAPSRERCSLAGGCQLPWAPFTPGVSPALWGPPSGHRFLGDPPDYC